ncbi:MAG: hypothetical protein OXM56_02950 [Gammaproteobacteria bacterium]|nr:hypothetical protein [Gammaproteobacteria bacterium]
MRLLARAALALVLAAPATASEYVDGWGPPVGTTIPEASFDDQAGQPRTFTGLMGSRGLLLFFNRSADW